MTTVNSPCISLCQMHETTAWCKGCWRTIDEIVAWHSATDTVKQQVWVQIEQRKKTHPQDACQKQYPSL